MKPIHVHTFLCDIGWFSCFGIGDLTINLRFGNIEIFYLLLTETIGIKQSHPIPIFGDISQLRMGMVKGITNVFQRAGKGQSRWFSCASQHLNQTLELIEVLVEVFLGVLVSNRMDICFRGWLSLGGFISCGSMVCN